MWEAGIQGCPTTSSTSSTTRLRARSPPAGTARVEELRLSAQPNDGVLSFPESPSGKPTRVVTGVDGPRLEREWTQAVRAVGRVE